MSETRFRFAKSTTASATRDARAGSRCRQVCVSYDSAAPR